MANVPESSSFDAGIYQIETADPVLGGVNGIANAQAKGLANRTKYLFDQQQLKAPLASPIFTGNPQAPTPASGDNDTTIATTQFVQTALTNSGFAPLASPLFTGDARAPTAMQFDADLSIANTGFVQRALGNYAGYAQLTGSKTVVASDMGNVLFLNAAGATITFPTPSSIGAPIGSTVVVFTTIFSGTLVPGAGASINYDSTLPSVAIKPGQSATLVAVTGTTWQVINATAEMKRNGDFASSLAASGYAKHPSGMIVQAGSVSTSTFPYALTFPLAFPTACMAVNPTGWNAPLCHTGRTATGVSITVPPGGTASTGFDWIAIGY